MRGSGCYGRSNLAVRPQTAWSRPLEVCRANSEAATWNQSCSSSVAGSAWRKEVAGKTVDLCRCRCGRQGALHAVDQHLAGVKASEGMVRPTGVSANLVQLV